MARILLIDDDVDLTHFLQAQLTADGHHIECLDSVERAWELLARGDFEVVLLDNKMPGMSGVEFLEALHECGLGDLQVILMTGHGTADLAIQAIVDWGALDYVIKPLDYGELCVALAAPIDKAA